MAGLDVNLGMLGHSGYHLNIIGVKLTCEGVAKISRIRALYEPDEFYAAAGQSGYLVLALTVGGGGTAPPCVGRAGLRQRRPSMALNLSSCKDMSYTTSTQR